MIIFCSWIPELSSFGECFLANYIGQMMVEDFDNHLVVFGHGVIHCVTHPDLT